jgi:hypothetical protein
MLNFSQGALLAAALSSNVERCLGFQFSVSGSRAFVEQKQQNTQGFAFGFRSPTCQYAAPGEAGDEMDEDEDDKRQWELFQKYHTKGDGDETKYRGTWTTYDYMGDVLDSTMASVNYQKAVHPETKQEGIVQVHEIVIGEIKSDCETCFDSENVRTFPVAQYQEGEMRRQRCASVRKDDAYILHG